MSSEKILKFCFTIDQYIRTYNEDDLFEDIPSLCNNFDKMFNFRYEVVNKCNKAIGVFDNGISKLAAEIAELLPRIEKAYKDYSYEHDREMEARRKYEKKVEKGKKYESERDFRRANSSYKDAIRAMEQVESSHAEAYWNIWQDLKREKENKEEMQRKLEKRKSHILYGIELINKYDEEKVYYKCLAKHERFRSVLNGFGKMIDEFKEMNDSLSDNPLFINAEKLVENSIEFMTYKSVKRFREYKDYVYKFKDKESTDRSYKCFYTPLVNRFEILASDDLDEIEIKEPVSVLLCKKAYEDAVNMDDDSKYNYGPYIEEDKFVSRDPKEESGFIDIKENVVLCRKDIFNNIDDYYQKIKKSIQFYINECNNNVFKVAKMLDSYDAKADALFKLLEKQMKEFKANNDKIGLFIESDIVHPNTLAKQSIEKNEEYIEKEILPKFKKHFNDYPVDHLSYGIRRYFNMRYNDEKDIFKSEIECYNMINEYEMIFMPLNRYKQQLIIEGYRVIWYLGMLEMMKKSKQNKMDGVSYSDIEMALEKEPHDSVERIIFLKGRIMDIQLKSRNAINKFTVFNGNMNDKVKKFKLYFFDVIYKGYVERIKMFFDLFVKHISNHYDHMCERMINKIEDIISLYEKREVDWFYKSLLYELPSLPSSEQDEENNVKNLSRNSPKTNPTPSNLIELELPTIAKDEGEENKPKTNEAKSETEEAKPDNKENGDKTETDKIRLPTTETKPPAEENKPENEESKPETEETNKESNTEETREETKPSDEETREEVKPENDEIKPLAEETSEVTKPESDEIKPPTEENKTETEENKPENEETDNKTKETSEVTKTKTEENKPKTEEAKPSDEESKAENEETKTKAEEAKPSDEENKPENEENKPIIEQTGEVTKPENDEIKPPTEENKQKKIVSVNKTEDAECNIDNIKCLDDEVKDDIKNDSTIPNGYRLLKYLILWKYHILKEYHPSSFKWLNKDIQSILSTFMDELTHGTLMYHEDMNCIVKEPFHGDRMFYEDVYDMKMMKLKYSIHGDWNWRLYKSIRDDLDKMCKNNITIQIDKEEKEFIQRVYLALCQLCEKCQSKCEKIIKKNIIIQKDYQKFFVDTMDESDSKSKDGKKVIKVNNKMLDEVKCRGFKNCFSCCIPGINVNYQHAGKEWCKEKCKNEKKLEKIKNSL